MKSKNQFLNELDTKLNHADRKELAYLIDSGVEKAIASHLQGKERLRWK